MSLQKLPEGSGTFRKVPEPSGTFLVCVVCKNIPEGSGTFRNILSGAPGSLYLWNEFVLRYTGCVDVSPKKVPEPSGTFRKVLECSLHSTHSLHVILLHFNVSPKNAHTAHFPHEHAF